jgi:cytochrome c-type biogenesis protein CcmH
MGWLFILLFSAAILLASWRVAKFDRASLQMLGAALLAAMAGYAWQGRPELSGRPAAAPVEQQLPDSDFATIRNGMMERFNTASQWLMMADAFHRSGDTRGAVGILRSGLRQHPDDPDLWVGLGNALVVHADGLMTPAAELAFDRAARLAPDHPGPKFFYGLALAQAGRIDEAETVWVELLARAPQGASWRPIVEERLQMLGQMLQSVSPPGAAPR